MKFGVVLPYGDARIAADFAYEAEQAGWDGFFVWEPVWGFDAWVMLTAAAMRTERIRLGTLLTPISRRRPWKLASETMTLDRLSNGRVILATGLGAIDTGFAEFGEETDRKQRAKLLDEGLDILTRLWRGEPFTYDGQHYHVKPFKFVHVPPPPVQQPRIPIWVVGSWGYQKSMQRALKYDGLLPHIKGETGGHMELKPEDIRKMKAYIDQQRKATTLYDIIQEGHSPGADPRAAWAVVEPWAEAGATWWIEAMLDTPFNADGQAQVLKRIKQGPPRQS